MATIPTAPPPQMQRQLATRSHGTRIALIVLLIVGGAFAIAWYLLSTRGKPLSEATIAGATARPWLKEVYPEPEKTAEKMPAPPVDTISPELARLRNEILAMKLKLEEWDKRKSGTTVVQPQQPAHRQAKPPEKRLAPALYYHKDIQDKLTPGQYGPGVYAGALGDAAAVYHRAAHA